MEEFYNVSESECKTKPIIVVFGGKGDGKSSLIHLLDAFEDTTENPVNPIAKECFDFQRYENDFHIFFEVEGISSLGSFSSAFGKLRHFLTQLEYGVSLLIHVVRKGRLTQAVENDYNLFVHQIFLGNVPTLLVLSGCETDENIGDWWKQEKNVFLEQYKLRYVSTISSCLTSGDHDSIHPVYKQIMVDTFVKTKEKMGKCIDKSELKNGGWKINGWFRWIRAICKSSLNLLSHSEEIPTIGFTAFLYWIARMYSWVSKSDGSIVEWDKKGLEWKDEDIEFV